jgi:hypothetical protein
MTVDPLTAELDQGSSTPSVYSVSLTLGPDGVDEPGTVTIHNVPTGVSISPPVGTIDTDGGTGNINVTVAEDAPPGTYIFVVRVTTASQIRQKIVSITVAIADAFSPADLSGLQFWLNAASLNGTTDRASVVWTDSSGQGNHPATEVGHVPIWDATPNRVIVMPDGHISYNGYMVLPTGFPVASNSFTLIAIMEKQSARKPGADEALVTPSYLIAGSVANTCNLYHDAAGVFIANTGGISHGTLPVPTNLSMTLVSCDDTTLRLRINEQEETFASEDSAVTFTEANILGLIGAFGAGPWQARVKHFVLYDRVLDAGEVTQIMEWSFRGRLHLHGRAGRSVPWLGAADEFVERHSAE